MIHLTMEEYTEVKELGEHVNLPVTNFKHFSRSCVSNVFTYSGFEQC